MILKVVDTTDDFNTNFYSIPDKVGEYIIKRVGNTVEDPCNKFSEDFSDLLYLVSQKESNNIGAADITFYLCY